MRGTFTPLISMILLGSVQAAEPVDYERDIQPLFAHKCSACHGALKQEAGLRLDAGQLIRQGSEDGPVLVVGDSQASKLFERATADDPADRMPPEGVGEPLTAEQLAQLRAWIDGGAHFPEDEVIPVGPAEHWAFLKPQRPTVPAAPEERWSHPIDSFIALQHRQRGLEPLDVADRFTLFRRLHFDLVGLPPSRAAIAAFVADESAGAWVDTIDALLENPHYGERWGRHWMDVWRYSDWDGYKQELRGSQRHIWHWRDWIVESLNADKGYDQMVMEMLAGDEIDPGNPSTLSATGFLARNYHKSNRNIWLDATVEHTAKAFLGLTVNCARCHDHKYDPIPQVAYYQFRAIFEPHQVRTDHVPGQLDLMSDGIPRAFDADLAAATYVYLQGDDKRPDKDHPVDPEVPGILGGTFEIKAITLPREATHPELRSHVRRDRLAAARKTLAQAEDAYRNRTDGDDQELLQRKREVAQLSLYSLRGRFAADEAKLAGDAARTTSRAAVASQVERELGVKRAELAVYQANSEIKEAENTEKDRAKAVAAAKKKLAAAQQQLNKAKDKLSQEADGEYSPLATEYPRSSTGRRTALARWIASPLNPLTARVAVNHIWMRHFGAPLVENVFDFGLRSPRPRHAELLDWLAVELMENNWSMKHMHRLILTSRTWRMASSADPMVAERNRSIDRDNHFLWRRDPQRLDAEIIRDNLLAVSGKLDTSFGGPEIDFQDGEKSPRRSIYLRHAYEKQMTMLVLFDAASPNECYRRSESIVPQQALAMTNSSLSLGRSRELARELWSEASVTETGAEKRFVELGFLRILSRYPLEKERRVCSEFLTQQAVTLSDTAALTTFVGGQEPQVKPADDPVQRARENLVHVLMNHNDFVTIR